MSRAVRAAQVTPAGLEIAWQGDAAPAVFPWLWLRDHCPCESCVHPRTAQRQLDTSGIAADAIAAHVDLEDEGRALRVLWSGEGHESRYPAALLAGLAAAPRPGAPRPRTLWDADAIRRRLPAIAWARVMEGEAGLREWLESVQRYGLCFVQGVPANPGDTRRLAERVAYIRESIFGGFWDFTADLAHGDTAYTNLELRPHTDGTYCLDPPGLQMFHCLHFEGSGGESVLVDGFRAAERLREQDAEAFRVLAEVAVPARYLESGVHLRAAHPVLRLDGEGQLVQVCFNNYDREPFLLPAPRMQAFYRALRAFDALLRSPELQLVRQLEPGEVLLFDNWRVLHGRRAYSGTRRLAGCYLNREDFESRLRVLGGGA